jgi:8-oxo-dGTP pyrophosphatase MutT (NUDIX family)
MSMNTITRPVPIRRLDGQKVYERRNLTVTVDQIVRPDGSSGEYVLVNMGCGYGVTIIPVTEVLGELKIAMIRQHRYPVDDYTLELPGGGAEAIHPDGARKELLEETGMTPDTIELLGTFYQAPGSSSITGSAWLAQVPASCLDLQHIEGESGAITEWHTVSEIRALMATGGIQCAITLAALSLLFVSGKLDTLHSDTLQAV